MDVRWASNKEELDFMRSIKKAVWNQSNQSGWRISAYGRPNWTPQNQTLLGFAAAAAAAAAVVKAKQTNELTIKKKNNNKQTLIAPDKL